MRTLAPARSQVNMIETRKREHSRKPDEQYELIESCSPGPYLEMFARHSRPNWIMWGDESADDALPRGKIYKGYTGGEIMPELGPHQHLDPDRANQIGLAMKAQYIAGKSIRALAEETGYSIQRVRSLLRNADTELRRRGRPVETQQLF